MLARVLILIISTFIFAAALTCAGLAETDMKVIDVMKFGAVPGDGKDDTAAVRAALAECGKSAPAILVFPKGRYDFFPNTDFKKAGGKGDLFPVSYVDGLTIDGSGSTWMFHGITGVLGFGECKNVTVKNIVIDFARAPFSQGTVQAVEGKHFDVKIDDAYPVTGGEPVSAFMDYDLKTGRYLRHGLDEYYTGESTELVAPQVLRVNLKHDARIKPGVGVLLRHQVYGNNAINFYICTNCKVQNVTVYCIPGMAVTGNHCTNVEIDGLKVVPTPGTGRLMSATADGIHLGGTRGSIKITNCEFDGMGDDAGNIKSGLYLIVREKLDDRTVLAQHNLKIPDAPGQGDTMEMAHQDDMLCYATGVVESVENLPEAVHKVTFNKPLPAEMKVGDVIGNASRVAKIHISNCAVKNNRARGFLIQNRDVLVENCRFENVTSGGVWVLTETVYFYESIGSRNVTVRNCVFDNCNYGGPMGEGVLCAYAIIEGWKEPPRPGIHKNILFENNTIRQVDNCAIYISGTEDVVVRNNVIEKASDMPTTEKGKSAIYIMSSRSVTVEGNTAEPAKQGEGCKAPLSFGPGMEEDTVTVRNNKGF